MSACIRVVEKNIIINSSGIILFQKGNRKKINWKCWM